MNYSFIAFDYAATKLGGQRKKKKMTDVKLVNFHVFSV